MNPISELQELRTMIRSTGARCPRLERVIREQIHLERCIQAEEARRAAFIGPVCTPTQLKALEHEHHAWTVAQQKTTRKVVGPASLESILGTSFVDRR